MEKSTKIAIAFVTVGLTVPEIIDAIETANHLDIKRDFGVLPWLIMTIVGAGMLLQSSIRHINNKKQKSDENIPSENET